MTKNLSENALLRQFLSRGAEEMWNCRFPIDSNLEKKGGGGGLPGSPQEQDSVPGDHIRIGKCAVKKSHIINSVPGY